MSKASIWARLKEKGFSDDAAAAIMGNFQAESAFRSNNVEDRSGIPDEQYTLMVDNRSYSRDKFIHDSYGYGLYQLTYWTRKAGYYDFATARGVSIADEQTQIDYMVKEMQTDYRSVYDVLMSGASIYDMAKKYMVSFENPYDQSDAAVNGRYNNAQAIYREFAGTAPDVTAEDAGEPQESGKAQEDIDTPDTPEKPFWPPRMLCSGMVGSDVAVLQAALIAHGYPVGNIDGNFGVKTHNMLMAYQCENNLAADGIAGRLTWGKLVAM